MNAPRPEWLDDVQNAIDNPDPLTFQTQEIIPAGLYETYEACRIKALAHGQNSADSKAAQLLYLFLIHKYKLWRAAYHSWEEFLDHEIEMSPLMPSKASVKSKVGVIDKLLEGGARLENIVGALGRAPTATEKLPEIPVERLPGGSYDTATEELAELGKGAALSAANDWEGKPSLKCIEAFWDEMNSRFLFKVRVKPPELPTYDWDSHIDQVDNKTYADWLFNCFRPAKRRNDNVDDLGGALFE